MVRAALIKKINLPFLKPLFTFSWWFIWFHFLVFSLIFFRAPTFKIVKEYLNNIFIINNYTINITKNRAELILSLVLIFLVQVIHFYKGNDKIYELITKRTQPVRWFIYISFILIIVLFSINRQNNFIYFQF